MSLREVVQPATVDASRTHRMTRITIGADGEIYARWLVELPNGKRAERSVPVSPALQAQITSRQTFQTMLDVLRDDTLSRTGV